MQRLHHGQLAGTVGLYHNGHQDAKLRCVGPIVLSGIRVFQNSQRDAAATLAIVKEFVAAGVQQDAAAGLALFEQNAPGQIATQQRVAQLFAERRDVFKDSAEVTQDSFTIYRGTNGTTATIQGKLTYPNQPAKRFSAQFHQTHGVWLLINITFADSVGG